MKTVKKQIRTLSILGSILMVLAIVSCNTGNRSKQSSNDTIKKTDTVASQPTNATNHVTTTILQGTIGSAPDYGSGWINLEPPYNFKKGDTLKIIVGRTAKKVLISLLNIKDDANSQAGIIGQGHDVINGEVIITLPQDYPGIKQISVHGRENPWGYALGAGNGAATLQQVTIIRYSFQNK